MEIVSKSGTVVWRECVLGWENVWKPSDDFPKEEKNQYGTAYW